MRPIIFLSMVTLLSLTGLTIAQTNAPAMKPATTNAMTVSERGPDQVLAGKLVGAGGFLGIDKKNFALIFSSLNVTYDVDNSVKKITANVTKESMKDAPAYYYLKKS